MSTDEFLFIFPNQENLEAFARRLAGFLTTGDTLLLYGEIGAGKSVFARTIIQEKLDEPEDVPSPTFTIIQTYETKALEIWHCDLYRLTEISQTDELGLEAGFETALCLIEWPEILGHHVPISSLHVKIEIDPNTDARLISLSSQSPAWTNRLRVLKNEH